jgi:hypothetical protein
MVESVKGSILDFAPQNCEVIGLYYRKGFNAYSATRDQLRKDYKLIKINDKQISKAEISLYRIHQSQNKLQYVFTYTTEKNIQGLNGPYEVEELVNYTLDQTLELGLKSAGFILIPLINESNLRDKSRDIESARAIAKTAELWCEDHSDFTIYLVDLAGHFDGLISD